MSCDLYAAIEQLYNNGMYSCVTELYPFIAASQTLSAAESANCTLFQVKFLVPVSVRYLFLKQ
jgi:hypothetical protein